jgi:hypothetical protein
MPTHWQQGYPHHTSWTGQDWVAAPANTLRIDPYLVWAEATDYVDLGGRPDDSGWVSIILQLRIVAQEFDSQISASAENQAPAGPWIKIHPLYLSSVAGVQFSKYITAIVKKRFFELLVDPVNPLLRNVIERFELGQAIVSQAEVEPHRPHQGPSASYTPAGPESAVVGVIDEGFGFAHERFLRANGKTRVDFLWDQGYFSRGTTAAQYGREHTNTDIDEYMRKCKPNVLVDEDAVYRLADYPHARRRISHGTLMADFAAGCDPDKLASTPDEQTPHTVDSHIIGVQLQVPSRRTRDRSAGWLAVHALDGLRYVLARADEIRANCPVVANMSFGNIAGPHDGSSMLESAIDELVGLRQSAAKFEVAIAAGNSNLVRCHAQSTLAAGQTRVLNWRVLPDDPTPNFLEIWLPPGTASKVQVTVTIPDGSDSSTVNKGEMYVWRPVTRALCTVIYLNQVATGGRSMVLVAIAPTASADRARELAPSGEWKVSVTNLSATDQIHAWIQRDETPFDFPRHGRQSRFEDPDYKRFEEFDPAATTVQGKVKSNDQGSIGYVRREGTINSIATGKFPLVVGGFRRRDGVPAPYSSSGPAVPPADTWRPGPNVAAVSDDSVAHEGVLGAGSRSGSAVAMDGTSVANASITRQVAYEMTTGSWPPPAVPAGQQRTTGQQHLEDLAAQHEANLPVEFDPLPPPFPTKRVGAGRVRTRRLVRFARVPRQIPDPVTGED